MIRTYIIIILFVFSALSLLCDQPDDCAGEGEMFSAVYEEYPDACCAGLTGWNSGMDTRISIGESCYDTGLAAGSPVGTCINCGNGICEDIEDACNCPADCQGGINSDYADAAELCESDLWAAVISRACESSPDLLPLCGLCAGDQPSGEVVDHSKCKSFSSTKSLVVVPDNMECVVYSYDGSRLDLHHINTTFNCCPDDLTADIIIEGNRISILEHEIVTMPCDCLCLYDMDYAVKNLEPGTYSIFVRGSYYGYSIEFEADLAANPTGISCEKRLDYPWNMESPDSDFCGMSTGGKCDSESECMTGGCSGQVCQSVYEEPVITTCEYLDCYSAALYDLSCGCVSGSCQWN